MNIAKENDPLRVIKVAIVRSWSMKKIVVKHKMQRQIYDDIGAIVATSIEGNTNTMPSLTNDAA